MLFLAGSRSVYLRYFGPLASIPWLFSYHEMLHRMSDTYLSHPDVKVSASKKCHFHLPDTGSLLRPASCRFNSASLTLAPRRSSILRRRSNIARLMSSGSCRKTRRSFYRGELSLLVHECQLNHLQTCAPSVFFRICYGIQPRIRKYRFVNLVTETLIS